MDGQTWALKADSLTSPLIVTVTVTVTDHVKQVGRCDLRTLEIQSVKFGGGCFGFALPNNRFILTNKINSTNNLQHTNNQTIMIDKNGSKHTNVNCDV